MSFFDRQWMPFPAIFRATSAGLNKVRNNTGTELKAYRPETKRWFRKKKDYKYQKPPTGLFCPETHLGYNDDKYDTLFTTGDPRFNIIFGVLDSINRMKWYDEVWPEQIYESIAADAIVAALNEWDFLQSDSSRKADYENLWRYE